MTEMIRNPCLTVLPKATMRLSTLIDASPCEAATNTGMNAAALIVPKNDTELSENIIVLGTNESVACFHAEYIAHR